MKKINKNLYLNNILKIKNFIPESIKGNQIYIKEKKDYLIVSYQTNGAPKPITLNKEIILDKSFFEIIGLYYGDGINTRKGTGIFQTGLSNSCPELHKKWIKFLQNLGINKSGLRAKIQLGGYNKIQKSRLFDYWIKSTNLSRKNIIPNISLKRDVTTKEYGLLNINYNSKLFRLIFNKIFDYSLNLIKSNKTFSTHFIRGLFAAEGHVGNRNGSLNYLQIPIKDKKRRIYVKNLFDRLGIKTKDKYERLDILGYLNFKIFKKFNLYSLHPEKNLKFEKVFNHLVTYGRVPALTKLKIIEILKNNKELTRYQISKLTNIGISNVHKNLRDLEIKNIITRSRKFLYKDKKYLGDVWSLIKIPEDPYILTTLDYCKK